MTERIRELVEQAVKNEPFECSYTKEQWLEKFAELIVGDCLTLMENCDGDLDFAIWNTKKHFGVEK